MRFCSIIVFGLFARVGFAAPAPAPAAGQAPAPAPAPAPANGAPAPAAGQKPAAPKAAASQPAEEVEKVFTAELEQKLETGLAHGYSKEWYPSAVDLFQVIADAPEGELKRDTAEFHFAQALDGIGLTQAAIEYYIDIILGHRSPEQLGRSLSALVDLSHRRLLDEQRLIDEILFGGQFGDLPAETGEFVEYYQGVGELRRGLQNWGTARLEALSKLETPYGWKARYAIGVERLLDKNDEGAEKMFETIAHANKAPLDVRNDARTAAARMMYGQKRFTDAFNMYSEVDAPIADLDLVLLEKAWDKVADRDERRALGMVTGLGAPIYARIFAPERDLIRAVGLNRLCQFRAAHLTVLAFRDQYADALTKIRERKAFDDDKLLRQAALSTDALAPVVKIRGHLINERDQVGNIGDPRMRETLKAIYDLRVARADAIITRGLDSALVKVADELLRVDEQMNIIDYEIGVGLFKRSREESLSRERKAHLAAPLDSGSVFYHFDGEYWSDELNDFSVFADDRCVQ